MNITIPLGNFESKGPVKKANPLVFGIIFTIAGILLLILAYNTIKSYNEKNKIFISVSSTVVDYDYNDDGLQAIIVEYVVDGRTYKKTSNVYSNIPDKIGSEISIKYNPNNPNDIIWVKDSTNIILPIIGGVFFLAGVFTVVIGIKLKSKDKALMQDTSINNIVQQPIQQTQPVQPQAMNTQPAQPQVVNTQPAQPQVVNTQSTDNKI